MRGLRYPLPAILLFAVAACSSGSDDPVGDVIDTEPESICQGTWDSVYDACIDKLSQTCVGLACLFIYQECQIDAGQAAGACCSSMTSTQQEWQTCIDLLPGGNPP